jgi:hypothetical protein
LASADHFLVQKRIVDNYYVLLDMIKEAAHKQNNATTQNAANDEDYYDQ